MSKRRKPQPKTGQTGLDKLERDLRAHGLPENVKYIRRPEGESKISAVFWKFIEPFKQYATTLQAMEKLVVLGICAWNAALLPKDTQQKLMDEIMRNVLRQAGEEWRDDLTYILTSLLKRKEQFFADDRRYIASYHLADTGAEYHLSMASTMLDAPAE
ncbi:MAG: hypothetical protein KGJ80_04735 [Chloroflexota bacterium]|nr:hypothetical protein [Chloroflexota bacterium]